MAAPLRLLLWLGITRRSAPGRRRSSIARCTRRDNQNIVIDEVVGFGITAWTAGRDAKALDRSISSFSPLRHLETVSDPACGPLVQEDSDGMSGFGVMADDALRAFTALIAMMILAGISWTLTLSVVFAPATGHFALIPTWCFANASCWVPTHDSRVLMRTSLRVRRS